MSKFQTMAGGDETVERSSYSYKTLNETSATAGLSFSKH